MARISAVSTVVPRHRVSTAEVIAETRQWLTGNHDESSLFERVASSSQVEHRSFVLPPEQIRTLRGPEQRAEIYWREGRVLAEAALVRGLEMAGVRLDELDALLVVSCTAPVVPGLDAAVTTSCGLSQHVLRIPMYQHGCAGGAAALAIADELLSGRARTAAVLSVELCSLGFQGDDLSGASLVGSALFADGAACAVLSDSRGRYSIVAARSITMPETLHLMGYDIRDRGTHLRLDRELPSALLACAAAQVPAFLADNGLTVRDVPAWLLHPGGPEILDSLQRHFGLDDCQLRWSRESLRMQGNLSSASILFVLSSYLEDDSAPHDCPALILGVGPGLTVQLLLIRPTSA